VDKTLQWEPTSEEFRTANPISSKSGLHYLETSIAYETKFDGITQRLEALKTKDPILVNQVRPIQFISAGCTYCQVINYVFEEYHVSLLIKYCPNL